MLVDFLLECGIENPIVCSSIVGAFALQLDERVQVEHRDQALAARDKTRHQEGYRSEGTDDFLHIVPPLSAEYVIGTRKSQG